MKFSATIYKEGINFLVEVPEKISRAFGSKRYIYVKGIVNGAPFKSTLVPRGQGCHKLFLKSEIRKAANIGEGDRVSIKVELDRVSRELPVPPDLENALAYKKEYLEQFNNLTASLRREMLLWLEDAKRPETRSKRIEKIVSHLAEKSKS